MEENQIAICRDNYENKEEMWKAITTLIDTLLENEYEVLLRQEDCQVYIIEYAYDPHINPEFGDARFVKLSEDEEENLYLARCHADEHIDCDCEAAK